MKYNIMDSMNLTKQKETNIFDDPHEFTKLYMFCIMMNIFIVLFENKLNHIWHN